jgi:pimeloyl-ACP methyl ester carboxylesterase
MPTVRHAVPLVALALSATVAAQEPPFTLQPGRVEHGGTAYDVDFGMVHVPMNRHDPDSAPIDVRFIRYRSRAAEPGPPLVYLAGGPGGSGVDTMDSRRGALFLSMLDERDVIAYDQRGTGVSDPRNVHVDVPTRLPFDQPGSAGLYHEQVMAAGTRVLEEMAARGVDVRGLTTEESADDLDAIRAAVGAEQLVLWGSSYGTHLALTTTRRHPTRVAALVLAGTEGPDHTFKLPSNIETNLERLAGLVRADPVYGPLMPDLTATLDDVLADLAANPRTVRLLPDVHVTVGKWDLQKVLSTGMGSRGAMQQMPARIYAMAHGEYFDLAKWAVGFRLGGSSRSAMSMVMDCASYGTPERLARIEREAETTRLGATIDHPYPCICAAEGMPRLDASFRAPVESDVPVLFVSGTLDGRTPVSNAEEIAAGFPNAAHLIVRGAAHGNDLFLSTPEIAETVRAFLRGEAVGVRTVDGPTWTFAPPFARSIAHLVLRGLITEGYDATRRQYESLRATHEGGREFDFDPGVLAALGDDLVQVGELGLAADAFRLGTVADPSFVRAWKGLGDASLSRGALTEAIAAYERVVALTPDDGETAALVESLRAQADG